ncbi:MAG: hypothetical protein ACR2M3_10745 [Thermomicrobiales bacterium]
MKRRFSGRLDYLYFLGLGIVIVVGLLPVTLPTRNDIYVPNNAQHYPVTPLTHGVVVAQQFPVVSGQIDSIALLFGTYQRANAGTLQFEIRANRDGGWKTLATQTIEKASLHDNAYHSFDFSPPLSASAGEQFQIVVQSDGTAAQGISLYATTDWRQPDGYLLTVGDSPQPGTALFRVSYGRSSGHVFQMIGPIWRRSTVLLSVRWQIVLAAALGVALASVVMLGRRLSPAKAPSEE